MLRSTILLILVGVNIVVSQVCPGCPTQTDIYNERKKFDFPAACAIYKRSYDCLSACPSDQSALTAYVADLCQPGTSNLNDCGKELKECNDDMMRAKSSDVDEPSKCSDIAAFFQCSNRALGKCSNPNITASIDRLTAIVSQMNMETGCDGKCASKVGLCMAGLTQDITNQGGFNHDSFTDMCRQLGSATSCIQPLEADGAICSTSRTNVDLADKEITAMKQRLSDLCNANGDPTDCALGYMFCGSKLNSITAQNGCAVMSDFLSCSERLPCKYSVEDTIKKQIKTVSAAQQSSGCPTIGGCTDRLQQCVSKAKTALDNFANTKPTPSIASFCSIGKTIEQCFIVVRQDPNCKIEKLEAGEDENKFFGMFGGQCGNVTQCDSVVSACRNTYASLPANAPLAQQCSAVGDAVSCVQMMLQSDVCTRVQKTIQKSDQALIDVFSRDCGNASACGSGVDACFNPVKPIMYDPDSAKAKDCPIIKTALGCIDRMKNSQICKLVAQNLGQGEQQVNSLDSKLCGAASSVQVSILLFVATLFLSLWK